MEEARLQSNISKVYWLNGSFAFMVLMPIIVPFFRSRGLSMENVYQLQAIFAVFVLLFEVPSGYFSDLMGRKGTLVLASAFHSLGFLIMAFAPDFLWLVLAEILLALAISLFSGTDLSLLYDSLAALKSKKAPIKIVGKQVYFRQVGESLAGLAGGWLLLWHFEAPAYAQAFVGVVPLCIALTLFEPPREKMSAKKHGANVRYIFKVLFADSKLLTLILLNGVFYSFATLVVVWMYQQYWQDVGIPLIYFGYLWFAINLLVAVTARGAHKLEKRMGSGRTLIIMGALPIIGFFGMGWSVTIAGAMFCLAFQVCRGIAAVVIADGLNKRVTGDMRATANSIMSLGTRLLMIFVGPLVGWMVDAHGKSYALNFLGYFYVGVFILLLIPLLMLRKQFAPIPGKG